MATVEYGGLALTDPFHVQTIEGLLGKPEVRTSDRPRLVRHGSILGHDYLGARVVTMTIDITAFNQAEFVAAIDALTAVFARSTDQPLVFTIPGIAGSQSARIYARPRRLAMPVGMDYFEHTAEAVVELVAADPLIYSNIAGSVSVGLATQTTGLTFPFTFPFSFGGLPIINLAAPFNRGNTITYPTIHITGPVLDPVIRNETTGQEVSVEINLGNYDYLDIDMAHGFVTLNGTANRYQYTKSRDWWGLVPGVNSIRYNAATSTSSQATINFRSAWV